MLRLAGSTQAIVFLLDGGDGIGILIAKGAGCPLTTVVDGILRCPLVDVPCEIHAEFELHLGRLDVAHIDDPQGTDALVVGSRQLVADKRGRVGDYPQVVSRRTPVGHVVVDAITT